MPCFMSAGVLAGCVATLSSPKSAWCTSAVLQRVARLTTICPPWSVHSKMEPGFSPKAWRTAAGTETWPWEVSLVWLCNMVGYYHITGVIGISRSSRPLGRRCAGACWMTLRISSSASAPLTSASCSPAQGPRNWAGSVKEVLEPSRDHVIPICIRKENKARSRRQCCSTARRSNAVIVFNANWNYMISARLQYLFD